MAYRGSTRYRTSAPAKPRWMDLRYAGTCTAGEALPAGTRAFYDPRDRSVTCTDVTHAKAAGLTRKEWVGSPVSGGYEETLSERRIESFIGEAPVRRTRSGSRRSGGFYRCTHEDFPCCGCGE